MVQTVELRFSKLQPASCLLIFTKKNKMFINPESLRFSAAWPCGGCVKSCHCMALHVCGGFE